MTKCECNIVKLFCRPKSWNDSSKWAAGGAKGACKTPWFSLFWLRTKVAAKLKLWLCVRNNLPNMKKQDTEISWREDDAVIDCSHTSVCVLSCVCVCVCVCACARVCACVAETRLSRICACLQRQKRVSLFFMFSLFYKAHLYYRVYVATKTTCKKSSIDM